jgi:pimeloyl-ACP methyl ester carboxylesterase
MKLLFIPGSGCGKKAWVYQTEYFSASEAIALPGHPEGRPRSSIDGYVEWLRGYIHQQQYQQDVILVGHSMGGAVVQLYGLKYGAEVKALVLIGTGARLRVLPALLKAAEAMVTDEAVWIKYLEEHHRSTAPEIRRVIIEERMQIGPAVMLNDLLACDKFDIMDRVHNIKLPTLIICGSEDEMTPVKYAHYLADKIEAAGEVIVNGAGHWVPTEKPKEVNQAIESFLAGLH